MEAMWLRSTSILPAPDPDWTWPAGGAALAHMPGPGRHVEPPAAALARQPLPAAPFLVRVAPAANANPSGGGKGNPFENPVRSSLGWLVPSPADRLTEMLSPGTWR